MTTNTQFKFLEDRLSPFRSQYLNQIDANVPELLEAFDGLVLKGYSKKKEEVVASRHMPLVNLYGGTKDMYLSLSTGLKSAEGKSKEIFLYGLRMSLLDLQKKVDEQNSATAGSLNAAKTLVDNKEIVPRRIIDNSLVLSGSEIDNLRSVSSCYKAVYDTMVDTVRAEIKRAQ